MLEAPLPPLSTVANAQNTTKQHAGPSAQHLDPAAEYPCTRNRRRRCLRTVTSCVLPQVFNLEPGA